MQICVLPSRAFTLLFATTSGHPRLIFYTLFINRPQTHPFLVSVIVFYPLLLQSPFQKKFLFPHFLPCSSYSVLFCGVLHPTSSMSLAKKNDKTTRQRKCDHICSYSVLKYRFFLPMKHYIIFQSP